MSNYKQVIVLRKFPNLRTGKYVAQGAHASQLAIKHCQETKPEYYEEYMKDHIRKIVVYVNTEQELRDLWVHAYNEQLPVSIVEDAGFTEFHGIKTVTAIAIGPCPSELIDPITKDLPLF